MPYKNAITPFCHVFNAEEEEDFLESETQKFRDRIQYLLGQLKLQDQQLSTIQLDFGVGKQEITWLADAIRRSRHLRCVRISNWPIGDYGAQCLAQVLADRDAPCQLEELSLRTCGILSAGATALISALESNTTCTRIDLSRNNLRYGPENLSKVFEHSIPRMTTLREMDLSLSCLDEACVRSLFSALTSNGRLRVLHLTGNTVDARTVFAMVVEFLPQLTSLERVILRNGGSLMHQTESIESLRVFLIQLQMLRERIQQRRPPRLYDLGNLCTSYLIDRYGSMEKQQLQWQCYEQMQLIELSLDRNRILSLGVLLCDDPRVLPFALAQTRYMRSRIDAVYFIVRQKANSIMH